MPKSLTMMSRSSQLGFFLSNLRRSRLLGMVLFGLAIFHLAMQLMIVAPRELTRTDYNRDVTVYWRAARNAYEGLPLYTKQINYGPDNSPEAVYIYPPPFAAILAPFGVLSFIIFCRIWFGLLLLAFWLFAYCLARLFKNDSITVRDILVWGLILGLFPGTYFALGLGQVDPILWALFAVGLVGVARQLSWGAAAVIKVFYIWPWLADVVDIARGNSVKVLLKTLAPAIVLVGLLVLYGGVICGWNSYIIWVRDVLPTLSQGNFNADNVSLSFLVLRIAHFFGWHYDGGALPMLAHLWLITASIGVPLLAWYTLRSYSTRIKSASLMAAAVLFAPVCWINYLPILLPLLALIFQEKRAQKYF